ncbi:MAG: ATPase, T2SS/T4P/T4SS family [Syntrophobacteraceae bacterium]
MPEAFDLSSMLAEIVEDEKISTSKRKKISQADIKRMLRERSQAAATKKNREASPEAPPSSPLAPSVPELAKPLPMEQPKSPEGHPALPLPAPGPASPSMPAQWASQPAVAAAPTIVGIEGVSSPNSVVPSRVIRKYRVAPMRVEGRVLYLGMENASDHNKIHSLELLTGMRVEPVELPAPEIERVLAALNKHDAETFALVEAGAAAVDPTGIRNVLRSLLDSNGFDALITPGVRPALKSHNGLEATELPPLTSEQCVRCAKGLMDERQWEEFLQRQEIDFAATIPELGRFRVNVYRQNGSVSLTIRKIPSVIPSLKQLEVPATLDSIALKPHGLVVFASPTGQGKTTTMAAVLHCINTTMACNVITLEDPVEYVHQPARSTINQREIGKDAASFAVGLKNVRRQAPDVIVIGEVRDPKTFRLALDAATAGHLVLCTMSAFNATNAIDHMLHQFPYHLQAYARQQLAESLLLVFCQKLVPTVDQQSLIVLHETLFGSPRIKELLREGQLSLLRTQLHQGEEDFVPMDLCLKSLLHEGRIAVQDGALLAENPGFVLGADIHPSY